jgi:uncharacterized protein
MYTMADKDWDTRPPVMAKDVIDQTAFRISQHAQTHAIRCVEVVFHGGEPLLAGIDSIAYAAAAIRQCVKDDTSVELSIQTNGTLLTNRSLRTLREHGISVGVSLDGDRRSNDRGRLRRDGNSTYAVASRGLELLIGSEYRSLFTGLLCAIDLRNDPIDVYEGLLRFAPPRIDFLLPYGNWHSIPPGLDMGSVSAPYAEWLIRVFDRWYGAVRQETSVRMFEELIHAILGGRGASEHFGLSPAAHIVIDTNGALEQVDSLRSAYPGAFATGLDIFANGFDDALFHPKIAVRQAGLAGLGDICRACSLVKVCGGGNYVHRYRQGTEFRNPSVYCLDLKALISHVRAALHINIEQLHESS